MAFGEGGRGLVVSSTVRAGWEEDSTRKDVREPEGDNGSRAVGGNVSPGLYVSVGCMASAPRMEAFVEPSEYTDENLGSCDSPTMLVLLHSLSTAW